jgi:xylose isomerase
LQLELAMTETKSYHSICAWTFNAGKGGFTPADMRPEWASDKLPTIALVDLIMREIAPHLPVHVELGLELHYDNEVHERNAQPLAHAMRDAGLHLAMLTPGAHQHYAYGGIAALDPAERAGAEAFGERTVELAYGALRPAWRPEPALAPTLVIWNGSFGYDLASACVREMYRNLLASLAQLCQFEERLGGLMYWGLEPKPNEGHPALLLPTVASALVAWWRLGQRFGVSLERKGVNKEFGHSEMLGLDPVYDTVEELECGMLTHMHLNGQGLNDGLVLGGPGKFDIDHGVRINAVNIAIASLLEDAGYARWKGHDMQPRPYDSAKQALHRVVRSILSWEACAHAARQLDATQLLELLAARETAQAEDLLRHTVITAQHMFDNMYYG